MELENIQEEALRLPSQNPLAHKQNAQAPSDPVGKQGRSQQGSKRAFGDALSLNQSRHHQQPSLSSVQKGSSSQQSGQGYQDQGEFIIDVISSDDLASTEELEPVSFSSRFLPSFEQRCEQDEFAACLRAEERRRVWEDEQVKLLGGSKRRLRKGGKLRLEEQARVGLERGLRREMERSERELRRKMRREEEEEEEGLISIYEDSEEEEEEGDG